MEEFAHLWNLCLFAPGINLIALTALIGRKMGGTRGIVASLTGMLLPSATITCLLAAGFVLVEHNPVVQAVLRGIVPATAGIMFLVGLRFAQPLFVMARKEGIVQQIASLLIILGCAIGIIVFNLSVVLVLLCAAVAGVAIFTPWRERTSAGVQQEEE